MREIKFRAWDGESFEYDVTVGRHSKDDPRAQNTVIIIDDGACWIPHNEDFSIAEQYTGLKDKNGVEIYEGDILQNDNNGILEVIEWNYDGHFCACSDRFPSGYGTSDAWATHVQVINNIHENPELLK